MTYFLHVVFSVTSVNIGIVSVWLPPFSSANVIILCMFLEYRAQLEITVPSVTERVVQAGGLSDKLQWTNEKISKLKSNQIKSEAK